MEMSALEASGSLLYSGLVPTVVCQQPKALDAGKDYYLVIPVTIRVITTAGRLERNIKEYGGRGGEHDGLLCLYSVAVTSYWLTEP